MKITFLSILLILSFPVMANKDASKHYKLTEEESGTKWRYYFKHVLSSGLKNNKITIERCYNMNVENNDSIEIPCSEMEKLKPILDLRELGESERSASAL